MLNRLRDSAIFHATRLLAAPPNRAQLLLPQNELFVSFTFDDFPRSALTAGARILEGHGARGTYYVAMGLQSRQPTDVEGFCAEDLLELAGRGHELGCHTHGHLDCFSASSEAILEEVAANAARLGELLPGLPLRHFAWPFGRLRPRHKALLGERFATLRSIFPGIHQGQADLRLLRANKLYPSGGALARCERLIDRARGRGGWVIFFTHDVCARPSPYGITPKELERLVRYAVTSGARVLPVGAVVERARGAL